MKKRVAGITLILVLLIGAGAATYALADNWGGHGSGMRGRKMFGHGIMRMLRTLDLSDDQKDKISSALMTARKSSIVSRAQLRVARMELHEALMQDETNDAAIEKLKEQIKSLQGSLLDQRIMAHQSIRNVLTPEQRKKARTLFLERMGDRAGGAFHRGRGHHGHRYERYHGGEGHHGEKSRH